MDGGVTVNWKKRKKRNKIMKHYGYNYWRSYQILLRSRCLVQYYKDHYKFNGWEDTLATMAVLNKYRKKVSDTDVLEET